MHLRLLTWCALSAVLVSVPARAAASDATAAQKARFDKMMPLVGTWTCRDTGQSRPYSATAKREGTWVVWRDTSENASSDYMRWNRKMQAYVVAEIYGGGINVSTTTDGDPLNASWKHQFPSDASVTSFRTTFSNNTFTVSVTYTDKKGKARSGRMVCRRNS